MSGEKPIIAAYLFGSTAKGEATEKSDIILLKDDFNLVDNFDYKLRLMGKLKDLTGKTVDIVFIDRTDPILQYHIRKHGKVIFERDKLKRIAYEIKARKDYFDFLFRHKKYMEGILKGFQETVVVDSEIVFGILKKRLRDIEEFIKVILKSQK